MKPSYRLACPALLPAAMLTLVSACALPPPPATEPRTVQVAKAKCPTASYPMEARRWQATGTTELEFEVSAEGKVTRLAVIKPSGSTAGHQALDVLARETIAKCDFGPAPGKLSGIGRMAYLWKLE